MGHSIAIVVNSSGQIGIGTTNPQSALDVTGAIRVSGGITPTYSSPSFSAGQIGYSFTTYATNSTSKVNTCVMTPSGIALSQGVWLVYVYTYVMLTNNALYNYVNIIYGTNSTLATFTYITAGTTYQANAISDSMNNCSNGTVVITNTSPTTYYFGVNSNQAVYANTTYSWVSCTRIA